MRLTGHSPMLVRTAVLASFGVALMSNPAAGPNFQVEVRDSATGELTAARVRLVDMEGRLPGQPEGAIGNIWGRSDRPEGEFFMPDSAFYVDGKFAMDLPLGSYTLEITKGIEFLPVSETLTVDASFREKRQVMLNRWTDMRERGWWSGDDHIHLRRARSDNADILCWLAAEDLHVGNILRMGDARRTYFQQYAFGPEGRYQERDRVLIPGQEDPRTHEIGHTISLNIAAPIHDSLRYYLYDRVFDTSRAGGGMSGYAHQGMSFNGYRGLSMDVPRGKVDFLELLQHCVPDGPLHLRHYYRFLDMGYRLTALAGSDFPWCGCRIGNARFYTWIDGAFSPDGWVDATRAGHTFVTDGPMLLLTVNGAPPGTEVNVSSGERLTVKAEALGHEDAVPLRNVTLIAHSQVVGQSENVQRDADGNERIVLSLEHPASGGLWIAAASTSRTGQVAHTTPVYVRVDGGPTWNRALLPAHLEETEEDLQEVEGLIAGRSVTPDVRDISPNHSRREEPDWVLVDRSEGRIGRLGTELQDRVDASRVALEELRREAGL